MAGLFTLEHRGQQLQLVVVCVIDSRFMLNHMIQESTFCFRIQATAHERYYIELDEVY